MTTTAPIAGNGMQTIGPMASQTTLRITATAFQAPWVTAHISVPFPSNYARQTQLAYSWPDPPQWSSGTASSLGGTEATSGIASVAAAATAAARANTGGANGGSGSGGSGGFNWPVWATAAIAGGGGFILLLAIFIGFCCWRKKRNVRRNRMTAGLPPAAPGRNRDGTRKKNYANHGHQEKLGVGEKGSHGAAGMAAVPRGTRKSEGRKGYRNTSANYPTNQHTEPQTVFGAGHPYRAQQTQQTPTNSSSTLYSQPKYASDPFRPASPASPAARGYAGAGTHHRVASNGTDDGFYGEPQPGFGEESYSQQGSPARLLPAHKHARSSNLYQDSSVPPSPVYDSHQDASAALGAAMLSGNESNENFSNSIRPVSDSNLFEQPRPRFSHDDVRNRPASPNRLSAARTISPVSARGESRQSFHDAQSAVDERARDHGHIKY